jgi:hypothetical protein
MNLTQAFETLDVLVEAYNGAYKSPYLGLSESERSAAALDYSTTFGVTYTVMKSGRTYPAKSWREGWYILNYETFHKAFDVDFERLGLLNAFDAEGKLSSSASYGNIASVTDPEDQKTDAYKKLKELWVALWGKGGGYVGGWYKKPDDLQDLRSRIKTNFELKELADKAAAAEAEKKRQEEERIRKAQEEEKRRQDELAKETALAETNFDLLDKNLNEALEQINQDLILEMQEFVDDEEALPELRWGGGTFSTLYIPGIRQGIKIKNEEAASYTPQKFKELIEQTIRRADFPNQALEDAMGLTDFKAFYNKLFGWQRYGGDVTAFFVNTRTNEIYTAFPKRNSASILVVDSAGDELGPDEKAEAQLALVEVHESDHNTNARRDSHTYKYVSFASKYQNHPKLSPHIPEHSSSQLFYYNDVTRYDSPDSNRNFLKFETLDKWVIDHSVRVATD